MTNDYPIHDLFIGKLKAIEEGGEVRIPILSFNDHLLRRFGFVDSVRLEPGYQSGLNVREVADEIWACLSGKVLFHWLDLREGSPSFNRCHELLLQEPTLALVPFGVAFGIRTFDEPAYLIRLSTHLEGDHEGDRSLPWEDETCP